MSKHNEPAYFSSREQENNPFDTIFDIPRGAVIEVDRDRNIVLFSQGAEEVFGYAAQEILGQPVDKILPPESIKTFCGNFGQDPCMPAVKADMLAEQCKISAKRKDGSLFPAVADFAATSINGQIIYSVILRDITLRKRIDEELQAGQKRLRNVIESADIATWKWNIQTGELEYNQYWAEIVGYRSEDISPVTIKLWKKLIHPDDLGTIRELLKIYFNGESSRFTCEYRMKCKSGEWVSVQTRGKVIKYTDDGEPHIMCGTHVDITSEKRAEHALRDSEKRLNHLLTASPIVVYSVRITNNNIALDWVGENIYKLFGYTQQEVLDPDWWGRKHSFGGRQAGEKEFVQGF